AGDDQRPGDGARWLGVRRRSRWFGRCGRDDQGHQEKGKELPHDSHSFEVGKASARGRFAWWYPARMALGFASGKSLPTMAEGRPRGGWPRHLRDSDARGPTWTTYRSSAAATTITCSRRSRRSTTPRPTSGGPGRWRTPGKASSTAAGSSATSG